MPAPVDQRCPESKFWADIFNQVWWMLTKLPYGESYAKWLQVRHPINAHKGLSLPFCLLCMYLTNNWSYSACVYTACHGTYGITWLLKEWLYRDASWETPCTLGSAVYLFVGMGLGFWINIVFLTLGDGSYDPSPFQLCMILTIYTLGIWLHHTADTQKYFVLRARKGLITDGLFSMSRNPNYLGEMFIYGSFAAFNLSHPMWWWPWVMLIQTWAFLFYPSWLAKERSMSRYKEWSQYTSQTGILIPWPFGSNAAQKSD